MTTPLHPHYVEKPWGRFDLPQVFAAEAAGRQIGEVWFAAPAAVSMALLVKYIFTSEKLSIQVHPNDAQAQARGLPHGKAECWYILAADPGATLGIGTHAALDASALRAAALDGTIEAKMVWHAVQPGDYFHIPPGTVHAIGAGVTLVEVQQNVDVTYRLHDYGRPRALHLDDGVAVSVAAPYDPAHRGHWSGVGTHTLSDSPHFKLIATDDLMSAVQAAGAPLWIVPLTGHATVQGQSIMPGNCVMADCADLTDCAPGSTALIAWTPV